MTLFLGMRPLTFHNEVDGQNKSPAKGVIKSAWFFIILYAVLASFQYSYLPSRHTKPTLNRH